MPGFLAGLIGNAGVVDSKKLAEDYGRLLTEGETIAIGYKLIRDVIIFTNKRMVLVNIEGVTGVKKEFLTIVYRHISRYTIESHGVADLDAVLKIWVTNAAEPTIEKKFNRKVNIYDLQKVLAHFVLG